MVKHCALTVFLSLNRAPERDVLHDTKSEHMELQEVVTDKSLAALKRRGDDKSSTCRTSIEYYGIRRSLLWP